MHVISQVNDVAMEVFTMPFMQFCGRNKEKSERAQNVANDEIGNYLCFLTTPFIPRCKLYSEV